MQMQETEKIIFVMAQSVFSRVSVSCNFNANKILMVEESFVSFKIFHCLFCRTESDMQNGNFHALPKIDIRFNAFDMH